MDASDALVAPREHPETRASSRRARTAFPAFASTKTANTAPSAFHRQVLSERHRSRGASSFDESPPPISRFCHRNPASDAPSPLQMLSHGTARPLGFNRKLFACGRLKGRAPPVDFCNRKDPRARPATDRPNPAHRPGGRPPAQLFSRVATLDPATSSLSVAVSGARPAEKSRARDQGAGALASASLSASHHDRSQRELRPNPIGSNTSCRKPVTSRVGVTTRRQAAVFRRAFFRACPTLAANAALASQGRFRRGPAKGHTFR
jgi:hypothetical protein